MRPAGSTSDAAPAREEHPAVVSLVLLAIWAVLTMLQIGLLPRPIELPEPEPDGDADRDERRNSDHDPLHHRALRRGGR